MNANDIKSYDNKEKEKLIPKQENLNINEQKYLENEYTSFFESDIT